MPSHYANIGEAEATVREKVFGQRKLRRLQRELASKGQVEVPGASPVSPAKAKEILRHGEVHGQPLTRKQKGLFGLIAGGDRPTRTR